MSSDDGQSRASDEDLNHDQDDRAEFYDCDDEDEEEDGDEEEEEDEEEDEEDEDDEEEEGDENQQHQPPASRKRSLPRDVKPEIGPNWSPASISRLLQRINAILPSIDANHLYDSYVQEEILDWSQVAFASFTADDCQQKWSEEAKNIRRSRYLSELVEEVAVNYGVDLITSPEVSEGPETSKDVRDVKDPASDPPPKPITALQLFVSSVRDKLEMQSKSRRITANAYSHIVKSWKKHPEKERIVFIRRAMENWKEYERKTVAYKKINPRYRPFQCTVTKEERALLDKVSGKPPKPAGSAYVLFLQDTLPHLKQHAPKERMGVVSQMWSELPEESKGIYQQKFNELQKDYRKACIKYEMDPARGGGALLKKDVAPPAMTLRESTYADSSDGYSLFAKMVAPVLRFNAATTEPDQRLMEMWKKLTPGERAVYEAQGGNGGGGGKASGSATKSHSTPELDEDAKAQQRIVRQLLAGAPKKPPSCAYHLFLRDSYPKLMDLPQKERTRLLARHWTNLPAEAKKPFALRTIAMQREYDVEFAAFLETIPPETRDLVRKKALGRRTSNRRARSRKVMKMESEVTAEIGPDDVDETEIDVKNAMQATSSPIQPVKEEMEEEEEEEEGEEGEEEEEEEGDSEMTLVYEMDEETEADAGGEGASTPLKVSVQGLIGRSDECGSDTETESGEE